MDSWLLLGAALLLLRKGAKKDDPVGDLSDGSSGDGSSGDGFPGFQPPQYSQGNFIEYQDGPLWVNPYTWTPLIGGSVTVIGQPALGSGTGSLGGFGGESPGGGLASDVPHYGGSGLTNDELSQSVAAYTSLAQHAPSWTQQFANAQGLAGFKYRVAKQNLNLIQQKIAFHKRLLKKIF